MNNSDKLLTIAFAKPHDGRFVCMASAVDTDEGTPHLWSYLEASGYVEKNTRSGRSIFGHRFSRKITEAGRTHLESLTP